MRKLAIVVAAAGLFVGLLLSTASARMHADASDQTARIHRLFCLSHVARL